MTAKFIGKAKLSRQGQVTLPYDAREELNIPLDSEVYWYLVDDYLVVLKDLLNPKDLAVKIKNTKTKNTR